jgi:sugar-specific transcriptional regulator TrmB/DNA-binding CsgD family transcriptional regulator
MLADLGLEPDEEQVFATLQESGAATATGIARASGVTAPRARRVLDGLEALGLVSRSADAVPQYLPLAADLAVDLLVARRSEELERARRTAAAFVARYRTPGGSGAGEYVERIRGTNAIRHRVARMQESAETAFLGFDKPPYSGPPTVSDAEVALLARGISVRVVYDAAALEEPGAVDVIEHLAELGEEGRVADDVPMKLALVDHTTALVPLALDESVTEALVVQAPCALLDALRALFEAYWRMSRPLFVTAEVDDDGVVTRADRRLVALLDAGLTETAVAAQLRCSTRTLERRVGRLMTLTGSRTRYQLGAEAVRRGWLSR